MNNMKDSKQLMDMVFEEISIDDIDIKAAGPDLGVAVPNGMDICTWMALMCAYNAIVPGSGGGTSIDACVWVNENC